MVQGLGIALGLLRHGGLRQRRLQLHDLTGGAHARRAIVSREPEHAGDVVDVLLTQSARCRVGLRVVVPIREAEPGLVDLGDGPLAPLGVRSRMEEEAGGDELAVQAGQLGLGLLAVPDGGDPPQIAGERLDAGGLDRRGVHAAPVEQAQLPLVGVLGSARLLRRFVQHLAQGGVVLVLELVEAAPHRLVRRDLIPLDPVPVGVAVEVLAGRAGGVHVGPIERLGLRLRGEQGRDGEERRQRCEAGVRGTCHRFSGARVRESYGAWAEGFRRIYISSVLRLAIAQLRPRKGAYEENLCRLGAHFRELGSWPEPPDLVVAPETALTGYFVEGGVRDLALSADQLYDDLSRQHRDAKAPPFDVALGFYELHQNRLYNAGLYATLGGPEAGIRHVHRKVFLPTYGVFDEERFVEAGRSVQAFDTRWGRAAILICEDAWHSFTPMLAALDGAQLILVPSASPARGIGPDGDADGRPTSLGRWNRIIQEIAGEHGVYVALSQLVGFEGGKAFPGGSIVADPRGRLVAEGPIFEEALVPATVDFEEITRARADLPLLADLEMRLPHLLGSLHQARPRRR